MVQLRHQLFERFIALNWVELRVLLELFARNSCLLFGHFDGHNNFSTDLLLLTNVPYFFIEAFGSQIERHLILHKFVLLLVRIRFSPTFVHL